MQISIFYMKEIKIKHPGKLHRKLKVPIDEKIPEKKLAAAKKKSPMLKKEVIFAENAKKWKKK